MDSDIATALAHPGCERLRDWASIGPVQLAALELFVDELGTPHCTAKLNALHANYIALHAECEALRKDAERYRWLQSENSRYDPVCHLSWKKNSDRNGSEWVNTANLDSAIDDAMGKEKA